MSHIVPRDVFEERYHSFIALCIYDPLIENLHDCATTAVLRHFRCDYERRERGLKNGLGLERLDHCQGFEVICVSYVVHRSI